MRYLALFVLSVLLGNWAGDKQTAIDCAQRGKAHLVGGTVIRCELIKDTTNETD